jgi:hypothetical protein
MLSTLDSDKVSSPAGTGDAVRIFSRAAALDGVTAAVVRGVGDNDGVDAGFSPGPQDGLKRIAIAQKPIPARQRIVR